MGATIGTRLMTWWKGKLVGEDQFGNQYYAEKAGDRRWVIYQGMPEASKVPPAWHAWLHYTTDEVPSADSAYAQSWEQTHIPNLTGTTAAYRPSGSLVGEGKRDSATGDYEAWRPE